MRVRKCIIPVAGLGTRFLPITKSVAKEMLPIVDRPTIDYIVEEAIQSGIEEILFVTSPYKKIIEDYYDHNYELEDKLIKRNKTQELELIQNIPNKCKVYFLRQGEPLGTGHAIKICEQFIGDEPFAVMYGDDIIDATIPALKQMIDLYQKYDASILCAYPLKDNEIPNKGIIAYENNSLKVVDLVEKPKLEDAPSRDGTLGRYILKPEIFKKLSNLVIKNGEYLLTDAILELIKENKVYACKLEGNYYDVGSKIGYIKANIDFALKRKDLKQDLKDYIDTI